MISHAEMPNNNNNTLKYNHGEKSLKAPWVIYADFECLPIKQQSCQNNPNDSYTERKAIHEPCGYSLDLVSSFESKQNRHSFYRGRDCTEKVSKDLKEQTTKIIDFKEKETNSLTDMIISFTKSKKYATNVKKIFVMIKIKKIFKLYQKVRDHCHYTGKFRGAAHSICNLRYKVQREIPVIIHNGSKYDYHFIIKELGEEFKGQLE